MQQKKKQKRRKTKRKKKRRINKMDRIRQDIQAYAST